MNSGLMYPLTRCFGHDLVLGARYHCGVSHSIDDAVYSYLMRLELPSETEVTDLDAPATRILVEASGRFSASDFETEKVSCQWVSQHKRSAGDDEPESGEPEGDVLTAPEEPQLKRPPMYKVLILNDDYTPMEFVVHILESFFVLSREKATQIMLSIHTTGSGVAGIFPRDIAETKSEQVNQYAQENNHPLMSTVEMTD